ncbi:MAG: hypothetical protein IMW85_02035 [Thermicanus sp.]|nr:hypothetical protein [Thermicanus sp.]
MVRDSEQIRYMTILMALGAMLLAILLGLWVMRQEQISTVKGADLLFMRVKEKMEQLTGQLTEVTGSLDRLKESQKALIIAMENVGSFSEESSASSEEVASISQNQREVSETLVKMSEKLESLSRNMKSNLSLFRVLRLI